MDYVKICSKCGQQKPSSDFTKDANCRLGTKSACKECKNKQWNLWRAVRTPLSVEQKQAREIRKLRKLEGFKECSICCAEKGLENFYEGSSQCKKCKSTNAKQRRVDKKQEISGKAKIQYYSDPVRTLLNRAKHRAKKNEWAFDLTVEYLQDLWKAANGRCSITGIVFDLNNESTSFSKSPFRPSLDRIDSTKGYTQGNVRFIIWMLNASISEYGIDVFKTVATAVLQNRAAAQTAGC